MRNVFAKSLLAAAVAGSLFGAAGTASAEVSASVAASSMYLWRGQNLTPDGAAVSGSLDYAHESGFYAGAWTSTETDGHETDLYAGFAGEVGGLGYDVAYFYYMYPEEGTDVSISDSAVADVYLGLTYGPGFVNLYQQVDDNADEDLYYQIGFTYDKFTAFYGGWELENSGPEYSHVQVDFAATDNLSFSVSKAFADDDALGDPIVEEDPLFAVSYSLGFDL
ncbi:MAG: hypothetical protein HUJ28_12405 [Chromatiales bacterium]|nr:hypothetical protein [Chromatiales bacterium]